MVQIIIHVVKFGINILMRSGDIFSLKKKNRDDVNYLFLCSDYFQNFGTVLTDILYNIF